MNATQLSTLVNNVNKSLTWSEYLKDKTTKDIKDVERYAKFKFLQGNDLNNSIQIIKNFDINQVWQHSFWKLKKHESICAVATEIYNNIKRIKNEY